MLNKATTFLWAMFQLNLLFAVSNIVAIVAVIVFPFHLITLPLYLAGLFLLVPSMLAMLLTLKRYDEIEKSTIVALYMRSYREEFKGSLRFGMWYILGAAVLLGAYAALEYFPFPIALIPLYMLLMIVLYVHFIFALLIRIHFIIDIKGTWRLGMYCISKYPMVALFIFGGTLIIGALMNVFPILILLGAVPLAGYLLTMATGKMFREIAIILKANKEDFFDESKNDSQ